jgi:monoterpene epsilon-lactone hydrolase
MMMPSFQARLITKILQFQAFGWAKGSIQEQRSRQEKGTRFLPLPRNVVYQETNINGVPGEFIQPKEAREGLILYLHGGAYALGSIQVHREFLTRLAAACQIKVLAINYRLAPEHPFPAALEDAISAYRGLVNQGVVPAKIVIAGDSAGGGLALATLISLRDDNEALPACAVCLSPWVNLASTPNSADNKRDPILNPKLLGVFARYYAQDSEPNAPLISPIYADLEGLPPLLIHVGTHEILLNDAILFSERARQANVEVVIELWEGMFHVFQIVPFMPESNLSLEHIAEFIWSKLSAAQ